MITAVVGVTRTASPVVEVREISRLSVSSGVTSSITDTEIVVSFCPSWNVTMSEGVMLTSLLEVVV